jgi:hypothetical protein
MVVSLIFFNFQFAALCFVCSVVGPIIIQKLFFFFLKKLMFQIEEAFKKVKKDIFGWFVFQKEGEKNTTETGIEKLGKTIDKQTEIKTTRTEK